MHRESLISLLGLLLCASSASIAQHSSSTSSSIQFHGIPASVTSPSVDGRFRGIPASVTDPTFRNMTGNFGHQHGNLPGHHHRGVAVVAVPYYLPYYGYYGVPYYDSPEYQQAEPQQVQSQQTSPNQVIVVKEESPDPTTDSDDSRYGEHSFGDVDPSRESIHDRAAAPQPPPPPVASTDDQPPMTTLVYRDGHKLEIRNYAIVGTNLIDLTKNPVMKKIPLAWLDLEATRRENEENGVDFHLP